MTPTSTMEQAQRAVTERARAQSYPLEVARRHFRAAVVTLSDSWFVEEPNAKAPQLFEVAWVDDGDPEADPQRMPLAVKLFAVALGAAAVIFAILNLT